MEALMDLFGLAVDTFGVELKVGWMALWPIIVIEIGIHWRFLKSFGRKTSKS